MSVFITGAEPRSIAEKSGIRAGDTLCAINGHDIRDVLDYRFYMAEKRLCLSLKTPSGDLYEKDIVKQEYDDLGLQFETYLMDSQLFCKNKCVFCFIDQLPRGLRESLYFKDDDSRMGFLFGNYITLTNLSVADIDRIIAMRISPVNISVHTMNPELRVAMMKNPDAGAALRFIKRLTDAGIKVNAQLVLCPGINDGAELDYSLKELCALAPDLQSIAVVPVGLTKYRDGLPALRLHTKDEARRVLETVDAFASGNLKRHGARICYAADEFYLRADMPFLPYEAYGDFDQLENGVGLLPLLRHEFYEALNDYESTCRPRSVTIATGIAAAPSIQAMAEAAVRKLPGLTIRVAAVENLFFGETITVAGLVTGGDLIERLKGSPLGDALIIPAVMLRHERDLFLDGVSLAEAEAALGCRVYPVENDGYALLAAIAGDCGPVIRGS